LIVENLGDRGFVLQFAGQIHCLVEALLSLFASSRLHQCIPVAAEDFHHPEAAISELSKGFQRILLGGDGRAIPPLVDEKCSDAG